MVEESARVTQVLEPHKVIVESEVKSTCSGCQQLENCGSGQVAKAFPHKKLSLTLETDLALLAGDTVVIGIPQQALLLSAWQVYGFPLLGLIVGALIAQQLLEIGVLLHEIFAILFAVSCGYVGMKLATKRQKLLAINSTLTPKILRKETTKIPVTEIQ
ncbi:SoxR reducing system RseC family protein [Thalassotalea ganghwensis]